MRRAAESPLTPAAKRAKRSLCADLAGMIKPEVWVACLGSVAEEVSSEQLACTRCGVNGALWLIVYEQSEKRTWMVKIKTLDGKCEIRARGLEGVPGTMQVCGEDGIFLDMTGTMHKIDTSGSLTSLNVRDVAWFAWHEQGYVVLRNDVEQKTLERRGLDGTLQQTLHFEITLPRVFIYNASRDTIIYESKFVIRTIDLKALRYADIVGDSSAQGCRDGYGSDARFHFLRRPSLGTCNSVYVRDKQPGNPSRLCHICLTSSKVETLDIRGFPHTNVRAASISYPHANFVTDDLSHFYVDLSIDTIRSTFSEDMECVDWSKPGDVHFKFAGGAVVHADRRVLCARSTYFSAMLSPETAMLEATAEAIDFTSAPIDPECFRIVVSYLATDELKLAWKDGAAEADEHELRAQAHKCLEVALLAHQYHLPRLVKLAETFVLKVVLPGRDNMVLPLLGQTCGSGNAVEQFCWDTLDKRAAQVLAATGEEEVRLLIERDSALSVKLMFRLAIQKIPAASASIVC